ncbi:MAG: N-6 DNA methylase [Candidatus Pacearchaeota archaeon]|nr:MAG: N-6 DNA methylase [Candidatus Pacearchaeota archaeon]
MVNERKTEKIIRDILYKNKNEYEKETEQSVIIEEQKSDNPRIDKLLKTASKKGSGMGYPEFIISFPNKDLIIVVECKGDIKYHKSKNLDKYDTYAVDGVLLYSSYLSKEFDVISIGASGQTKKELVIDTYLQIRREKNARDLKIQKIYEFVDYFGILKKDDIKEKVDFKRLIEYSQLLNQKLRDDFEFEENLRPLIVSGILLALEDEGFCLSYLKKEKPLEIADLIITTIKERLERDNIKGVKQNTIVQTYGFMRTNTKIINAKNKDGTPNTLLKDLIKEVEYNIKPFSQNYRFHDILGLFYNEFLRYANSDGGLGIVLTPKHITELFSDLAEVNKDSIIIDNCCGTGGFLISAMRRMEEEAKGDKTKIKHIHKKQLIGIENNPKMFVLACSNMMLRGDGKSNIHQQDCFEINEEEIKKFKPTIAFLNPPYSKGNGHKELTFIENALSFLEPNGICIAIVPQSCAMNTKKGNLAVKKRLLQKHTLKAVMSMSNTLFEDSNTNAVACILIFEAHKQHSKNTKTWFGYWKNDGFIKVRPYGRIDYYGIYRDKIKKLWLNSFFNKKEIEGFSILRHVDFDDELLVEPYIKTKFKNLTDKNFEKTLREYSTFLYHNELQDKVSRESYSNKKLKLDFKKWKFIQLKKLFDVKGSKTTDKKILEERYKEGKYPYVTTQATNNGVRGFYNFYTDEGNVLTIDSATIGFCSYQPLKFSASDHVEKLIPKFNLNVFRALFLATIINMEQYRYSYGRKFNQDRIKETIIKLPFKNRKVDWDWIENYIKGLNYSKYLEINS